MRRPGSSKTRSRATNRRRLTRRRILSGTLGAAGLAALGQGSQGAWSAALRQAATPVAMTMGEELAEPPLLRSADGHLQVALAATYGPATMASQVVTTYTYNGMTPGPTLRMKAGEALGVTLTNLLGEGTNFHTHGLHVSPSGTSDNVLLEINPGKTVDYTFDIPSDALHPGLLLVPPPPAR